ncbi:MAG: DUF1846 domain-containing protein [Muribaculaceae bacterium]|nr:DUF1846 domain-containing protein [Muribaculaceae bacterium]
MKYGFDNDKYLRIQSEHIKERIAQFGNKLYLELGGKLFDDHHASRVLPGFQPDSKLRMLSQLADHAEIVIVISAVDIEKNKVRSDLGITYDMDVLRLREEFQKRGFLVSSVVITHYDGQASADAFRKRLERIGVPTYIHYLIDGYPANVDLIDSDDGFGRNDYIPTTRPLVIVTAPGPGSGKMAVCLSQLYNEHKHGVEAGYAKFEDIEIFPVLNSLFEGIYGKNPYKSPTDMGVNMVGFCINDDEVCRQASNNEIIRRYYDALDRMALGDGNEQEVNKIALLFKQAGITVDYRRPIAAAKERAARSGVPCSAIELADGTIITAESGALLGPSAALILNAIKHLAGIDHSVKLIPQSMIEPIQYTKLNYLRGNNPRLHTDEVLVALSVLSTTDDNCRRALERLPELRGCQVHSTVMLGEVDHKIFKKLGVGLTCDPVKKK